MNKRKIHFFSTIIIIVMVFVLSGFTEALSSENNSQNCYPSTEKNLVQPSIAGSDVYDIVYSLEMKGIPKAQTQRNKDLNGNTTYQHASSGMDDTSFISYNITSDQNHAVSYAVFNVNNDQAPWYLPCCATMPYDSYEPKKAAEFVRENANQEAMLQIGDAIFQIYPNKNGGAMLTITAVGYEQWCIDQLMKQLQQE